MIESILTSVKKYIGFDESYEVYDDDLLMLINSEFSTLTQLGLEPDTGFKVVSKDTTWDEVLGGNPLLEFIKEFVYLRVKIVFDPPSSGSYMDALQKRIDELTFRINVAVDTTPIE